MNILEQINKDLKKLFKVKQPKIYIETPKELQPIIPEEDEFENSIFDLRERFNEFRLKEEQKKLWKTM